MVFGNFTNHFGTNGPANSTGAGTNATKGTSLLDIGERVKYIGINDPVDKKIKLATITEQDLVSSLVGVVLEALVDQTVCSTGNQVFIEFHPKDGTKVNRNLWSDTRELHGGTMLLDDFWEKIKPFVPATSELEALNGN